MATSHAEGHQQTLPKSLGLNDEPYYPVIKATKEEMDAAQIQHSMRDCCVHILIPLNECRRKEKFLPWKCSDLRHAYEKCQYEDWQRRVEEKKRLEYAQIRKSLEKEDVK